MQAADERLITILRKAENSSEISLDDFANLEIASKLNKLPFFTFKKLPVNIGVFVLVLSYVLYGNVPNNTTECILDMPSDASKIFREPENCDICTSITKIDKIANVSDLEFNEKYVKPARPLVVTDGAVNWPAIKYFNFNFFKKLYTSVDVENYGRKSCQFFPYNTEFKSLEEVFEMKTERAQLSPKEKSWYVGWSNCNDDAGKILQKYYDKPYFLSNNSENIALSWIFMGGPGHGAHMHVDNVHYPSWQAQLSGKKLWILAPPPECLYRCKTLQVIVEPGEIIVVDTNRWYHQTFILPDKMSITIGSEFD